MAQYLKDAIREKLVASALSVFAAQGYAAANMGEIARAAGVSTGNVYRYFPTKQALFEHAVDEAFVAGFRRLLRARVRAASGGGDLLAQPATAPHPLASEALLEFCAAERERVIIVLGRAQGTRWESLRRDLVLELIGHALRHFGRGDAKTRAARPLRFTLEHVYENLIDAMVDALATFSDYAQLRESVSSYSRYHLSGLQRLLGA